MIGDERQREKRMTVPHLRKSIARLIKALEKELAGLNTDIDDAVRGSPVWCEKEDLLKSVPGVGVVIASTLIAELPEPRKMRPQADRRFGGAGTSRHLRPCVEKLQRRRP